MALNEQEKKFIASIYNKVKRYQIDIDIKELLNDYSSGSFVETRYNTDEVEIVDAGIEYFFCRSSFYYFLDNYCRVMIPGKGVCAMEPYHFQEELAKEITDWLKIVLDKTRQCGMSTIFSFYAYWRCNFFEAEMVDVVSTKQKKAKSFVDKIRPTMKALPDFLTTPLASDNQLELSWMHPSGAESKILSESQSDNAGRGDTLSLLILDEIAFYQSDRMVRTIISSAQPTLTKTGGQMILISTPNGMQGAGAYYYEQVIQARLGKSKSTKYIDIDWWEIPDDPAIPGPKKGMNDKLLEAIAEGYYHNKEVKKKYKAFFDPIARASIIENEWLAKQLDDLQIVKYKQEILHDFIMGGNKVFSSEILDMLKEKIKPPLIKDRLGNKEVEGLWIWSPPKQGARYILAADCAKGTANDYSTFQILDAQNYEQVAEYKSLISTPNFARLIKKVARYYNEAYVVIECNSIGEAVFTHLYNDEYDPYRNMYKTIKKNKKGESIATGWMTTTGSRKLMTNELIDFITVPELFEAFNVFSERFYIEATTWIYDSKARPDHVAGANDDALIAMAIALYLRAKAQSTGESFLVAEDGELIEYDKNTGPMINERDIGFGIVDSEDPEDNSMDKEMADSYKWLIG